MWHRIFGHYGIWHTQQLMKSLDKDMEKILCPRISAAITCSIPLFRSCLRGKGSRSSLKSNKVTSNKEHTNVIKEVHLHPEDRVSSDQFECRVKGLLSTSRGKEDPHKIYSGGTVFIDHATGLIDRYNQVF